MTIVLFFALILSIGIWSAEDTGPHHPVYIDDRNWYEENLHSEDKWHPDIY
jgi:hypothetical protein